ncbi:MAG: PadR family transcriptional regulator [Marinoscillum sp.]
MIRENIGELEELVMLIAGALHPEAYAVVIRKELLDKMNRKVVLSSVHTVLNRLESKGYLISEFGEATPERGGKRKRYFTITQSGLAALKEVRNKREQLFSDLLNVDFKFQ